MRRVFLLLTLLSLIFISCEKNFNFSGGIYGRKPGNPDTLFTSRILKGYFVTSIAFDNLGNAWIGTFKQGLIKYNPKETVIYNSSNSILKSNSVIWDIAVDSRNNVWMGCDGLLKFDGTGFTLYNSLNTPIPEDFVSTIAIDSKDNIWFTSCRFREGGVVKYDGITWNVFTPDNSDLPANLVHGIAIDREDNAWLSLVEIVTDTYLTKITPAGMTSYTGKDLGFTPYYMGNIEFDSMGGLCGAVDYSLSSTYMHDGPQVFIFNGYDSEQLKFDDIASVKSLTVDNEDNIWCCTSSGFAVFNGKKWTVDNSTFSGTGVFAIEQAKDDRIWIGTGNGIWINGGTR